MSGRVVAPGPEWDEVLRRLNEDDIYFDHRYADLHSGPGARAEAFFYESGGRLFFLASLARAIPGAGALSDFETPNGYGGPLASSDDPAFLDEAWAAFARSQRERGLVAGFLRLHPLLGNERLVRAPAEQSLNRATVRLTLNRPLEEIVRGYTEDCRGKVRKAEKAGVRVETSEEAAALEELAGLYGERMGELAAAEEYRFDAGYFRRVASLGPGRWRVYLARHEGRTIGAALILLSRRFAHYHLSSSPREFQKLGPNNALRHAVIVDQLGSGREEIHFGGGKTTAADDPLLKFKAGFSTERAEFRTGRVVTDPDAYARLCADWARLNPDRAEAMKHIALRYRL
ncbi:MAG: GNAT family N-acetyltransferase [Elusimicrobia bacterium]|nr:GNAT family N-acetyltransferase [Elusimicrobiota bacterium]